MSQKSSKSVASWFQSIASYWARYAPPVRPSKGEIKKIESFIRKRPEAKQALILGATPELRDLVHKLKLEVTIVDLNLDMIMAMMEHMRFKKKCESEIWVRASWLDMPLKENHWDFVLGDFVICNLPFKLQIDLYQKVASLLIPDGYFITRMFFPPDKLLPLEEVIRKYANAKINKNELHHSLIGYSYNQENYQAEVNRIKQAFKKAIKRVDNKPEKLNIKKEMKRFDNDYPDHKVWWPTPKLVREKQLRKHFKIANKQVVDEFITSKQSVIYFLKKK